MTQSYSGTFTAYANETFLPNPQQATKEGFVSWIECLRKLTETSTPILKYCRYRLLQQIDILHLEKDCKRLLKIVLDKANSWDSYPLQDYQATYITDQGVNVSGSSMAESYECPDALLIDYPQATPPKTYNIQKDHSEWKSVSVVQDIDQLTSILIGRGIIPRNYDVSSNISPRDEESMLIDPAKFIPTGRIAKIRKDKPGRRIYKEITTGRLCYIDEEHYGSHAHIEVFDGNTLRFVCTYCINDTAIHHENKPNEINRTIPW